MHLTLAAFSQPALKNLQVRRRFGGGHPCQLKTQVVSFSFHRLGQGKHWIRRILEHATCRSGLAGQREIRLSGGEIDWRSDVQARPAVNRVG